MNSVISSSSARILVSLCLGGESGFTASPPRHKDTKNCTVIWLWRASRLFGRNLQGPTAAPSQRVCALAPMLFAGSYDCFGLQDRDAASDHFSSVVFFARGLFPHACLQRSLDTDEPALAQILIAMLCGLPIRHDSVPLRGLLRVAVPVVPVIVRRDA